MKNKVFILRGITLTIFKKEVVTLKSQEMVSMEMTLFLAKFWSVPVRKACGKKNPEIQYTYNQT